MLNLFFIYIHLYVIDRYVPLWNTFGFYLWFEYLILKLFFSSGTTKMIYKKSHLNSMVNLRSQSVTAFLGKNIPIIMEIYKTKPDYLFSLNIRCYNENTLDYRTRHIRLYLIAKHIRFLNYMSIKR